MALTDDNNMVMPVTPMYGGNYGGGMGLGGDWAWILLHILNDAWYGYDGNGRIWRIWRRSWN